MLLLLLNPTSAAPPGGCRRTSRADGRRLCRTPPAENPAAAGIVGLHAQHTKNDTEPGYRLAMREVRHCVIGTNEVPDAAWIDILDDAIALIGKRRDAEQFRKLTAPNCEYSSSVAAVAAKASLAGARTRGRLTTPARHRKSDIYLRQVDIPSIHPKFIESHCATLSKLLDLVLHAEATDDAASGTGNFARRCSFRDKPL